MTDPERPELQKSGGSVTRPDREHMSADAGEERDVMLPCPFCGGGGVEMHPHDIARHGAGMPTQDGAQVQYAHCNGCGAEGPQAFTYAEAQTAWNTRAAITAYTSGSGRDLFREGVEAAARLCDEVHRENTHSIGISLGSDARAMTAFKLAERIRALSRK